jgi:hypothetical protein
MFGVGVGSCAASAANETNATNSVKIILIGAIGIPGGNAQQDHDAAVAALTTVG